jgi:hypothetical protein
LVSLAGCSTGKTPGIEILTISWMEELMDNKVLAEIAQASTSSKSIFKNIPGAKENDKKSSVKRNLLR